MDKKEMETRDNLQRQLNLFENILKASSVEEIFMLRDKSGLFEQRPLKKANQKTLEEFKELAKESVETIKNILGENNGNN